MKVHQALARALFDGGIGTMFGLVGDANMFMVHSFVKDCGGKFIGAAHEAGATSMALGFAAIGDRIGVCTVTHGPGFLNTLTSLVQGVRASLPMVLLCGETDVEDRGNSQRLAQREFVIATGAGYEQLRSPRTVGDDVARALRRALVERKPVVLNIPVEFDWREADNFASVSARAASLAAMPIAGDDLDDAIGMIASAKRPLLLAGRGAVTPEGKRAMLDLAKRLDAPVATTLKAKGLFRGEPGDLGIMGTLSTPDTVDAVMAADCIVAFGAGLNLKHTLSGGAFRRGKRIVQISSHARDIGNDCVPDMGLVGDPAEIARTIVHWLDQAEIAHSGFRSELSGKPLGAASAPAPVGHRTGTVDYTQALQRLDTMLPTDRILVMDGGRFLVRAWTTLNVADPRDFLLTTDFGSIGLGMGHAIGAAIAAPEKPTVLVIGDGGFMHGGLAEFNTAVRYRCDLIVIVCNDGAYGAEHIKYVGKEIDPALSLFDWPDFTPLAQRLGGRGIEVRSDADWSDVDEAIAARSGPLLIDMKLDADAMPWL